MKKYFIGIILLFILGLNAFIIYKEYTKDVKNVIKDNYIAVFKGEIGETVYKTYLYEKKSSKKLKYSYINTESTMTGYDNTSWTEEIVKKDKIKKIDDIWKIVEKNNAIAEVKYQKDNKIYTLEEFKKILEERNKNTSKKKEKK